jgi:hypothetical protein
MGAQLQEECGAVFLELLVLLSLHDRNAKQIGLTSDLHVFAQGGVVGLVTPFLAIKLWIRSMSGVFFGVSRGCTGALPVMLVL